MLEKGVEKLNKGKRVQKDKKEKKKKGPIGIF
jgi:hypothetical protein